MRAGTQLLMDRLGVAGVDQIQLAGAFGSHIDPLYAMALGLLPDCDEDSVRSAGNAAGAGALMALLSVLRRADHLTDAHQAHLDRLFEAHPRLRTAWDALQELYRIYEADDLDGANEALGRFADLYASGRIPEYREIVDTIIAWGEEILAYHTSRRVSNGPLEGINNLLQVLRRVAHGFTNYNNYAARGILVT